MVNKLEQVLDAIAEAIISSPNVDPQLVNDNQKTIRNGIISRGRSNSEKLMLLSGLLVLSNNKEYLHENDHLKVLVNLLNKKSKILLIKL